MRHEKSLCAAGALIGIGASAVAGGSPEIEVVFAVPAEVVVNELVPGSSQTTLVGFVGQPRIDNEGSWAALYTLPSPNLTPIEITRNTLMLRGGAPFVREGLQLAGSPSFVPMAEQALSQQPFSDISINSSGVVAQILSVTDEFGLLPDGTPDPNDLDFPTGVRDALVVDRTVVLAGGDEFDVVAGLEFPDNRVDRVSIAKINGGGDVLVRADLSEGGTFDQETSVLVELAEGAIGGATLRLSDGDDFVAPGLGFELSTFAANEADIDFNDSGDILLSIDIGGASPTTDGAILRYDGVADAYELLAREGDPSPLPDRTWTSLFNVPVALNDAGHWAFRGRVSGDSTNNAILVRNGEVIAQEGMAVGSVVEGALQLGLADANIEMDESGNVVWYGVWNTPKDELCPDNTDITSSFAIFEALFFNDQPLIEAGVTTLHDVTIDGTLFPELVVKDVPNTPFGGFALSPDGRFLIAQVLVAEPDADICAFSVNNDVTPVASVLVRVDLTTLAPVSCGPDLTGDGVIDSADLNVVLGAFGCAEDDCAGDVDGDATTDSADLNAVLGAFGQSCDEL